MALPCPACRKPIGLTLEFINTDIFIKTDVVRPNVFYNINPDDAFNEINYIYKKQLEWDSTVIKRPYSD